MATALTLYSRGVLTGTILELTTAGSAGTGFRTATTKHGGWVQLGLGARYTGTAYATVTAIPAPTGIGAEWFATTLAGKTLLAGTYTVRLKTKGRSGLTRLPSLVRFYRKNGATYTKIGQFQVTSGFSFTTTATTVTLTGPVPAAAVATGTHLYMDVWVKRTTTTAFLQVDVRGNVGTGGLRVTAPYSASTSAPNAPTLETPANASYLTETSGVTFKAKYTASNHAPQTAYALRIKTSTSTTYKYWNGTALQSSVVYNILSVATGASFTVTLGGAILRNGTVYHWSVASEQGTKAGSFATDFAFTAAAPPSLTVTAPTGTATEGRPTVKWVTSAGSPTSQTNYRVVIYTKDQHTATGFTPGGSPHVWDSGTVASGATSVQIGTALQDNTTYYVYVQVKQDPTQTSAWAYSSFTTLFAPPAKPTVTAAVTTTATTSYPIVKLTIQCHTNILTTTSAAFGSGVGKWSAGSNTTIARATLPVTHANVTACMKLTATASGSLTAHTKTGATGFVVVAGKTYTIMGTVLAHATSRTATLKVAWYKSGGTLISTTTVGTVASSTTTWKRIKATKTAPATAKYAEVEPSFASVTATTIQYATAFSMNLGTVATFTPGGYVGTGKLEVLRSDGLYVRGASTLNPHTITDPGQTAVVDDFECIPTTTYTYTARVVVASLNQVGPTSTPTSAVHTTITAWWMIDPTATATAVSVNPLSWNPVQTEQSAGHMVMTQPTLNIVASAMMHQDFQGSFWTNTATVYKRFQALLTSQKTVMVLSSIAPTTDSGYFRVGPQSGGLSTGVGNKAKTTKLEASTKTAPVRTVGVTAVAQARPPV